MNSLRSLVLLAAATLLLSACSTAPRETAQSTPAAGTESSKNLRRGMTEDQIRAVWGEPQTIHPGNEGVKLLVYQFDVLTTQRMIAASLEEVPAYDPITGEAIRMVDPKLVPQKVTVVQTISLLLRDGQLQSWSRQLGEQRSFN